MCECRARIESELKQRFIDEEPSATGHDVKLQGYAIIFGGKTKSVPFMAAEMTAKTKTKTGNDKVIKHKTNMLASFCPFCGKKIED